MVEYRRFALGILVIYVIVTEILVLPVIWLQSWISGTHRCPMTSALGNTLLKSVTLKMYRVAVGIFSLCALELEICLGGNFSTPPPLPANVANKPLPDRSSVPFTFVTFYRLHWQWEVEGAEELSRGGVARCVLNSQLVHDDCRRIWLLSRVELCRAVCAFSPVGSRDPVSNYATNSTDKFSTCSVFNSSTTSVVN